MSKKPKIKPKPHKNDMFLDITSNKKSAYVQNLILFATTSLDITPNKKALMSKMPKHTKYQNILNAKTY